MTTDNLQLPTSGELREEMRNELVALRAERDALLEDKARLDWLQQHKADLTRAYSDSDVVRVEAHNTLFIESLDYRKAIDNARQETEAGDG